MTDNEKIAQLTAGALTTTMEAAKKAMLAAVEAAEDKAREMRAATEEFIADFERVTGELSHNVTSHVHACQSAIDAFQAHHLKILNGEAHVEPEPMVEIVPIEPPHPTHTEAFDRLMETAGQRRPVPPPPAPLRGSVQ